jgi:F5/8 type C domain
VKVPDKKLWKVAGSSGEPSLAIDDLYATTWISEPSTPAWLRIDLGEPATLAGLEVYWGKRAPIVYSFESSLDNESWSRLCRTEHGEGGQDVFAFPPASARFVRWTCTGAEPENSPEIVEINLYGPGDAAAVLEPGRVSALGHSPVRLPLGESITVDFGRMRSPLGAFIVWGKDYGAVFSVHLSDDGASFREVGRILTGNGGSDSFWWRSTTARFLRLTVHEASSSEGAVVDELKLRILNKDRMPIGQLERAALAGRGHLYPQTLLGRQVYWTVLGGFDQEEEALFDEYGNLEPQRGSGQTMPFLRLNGRLHGATESAAVNQSLAEGSLPVPSVVWSAEGVELRVTALAHAGQALAEYRIANRSGATKKGSLVLTLRPVQINPYWQHGGHAAINAVSVVGALISANDKIYAAFSSEPATAAIADFDDGDVLKLIDKAARDTARSLRSGSGLLSAAVELPFSLRPGRSVAFLASFPMQDGVAPDADVDFRAVRKTVIRNWRDKLGPRRITVGDGEVSDTVEAPTALILVNATRFAFKPGPRNYDRTWIRDGSSQALALLWAGLVDEAKDYVLWYSKRIYPNGLVPPILNVDGTVNKGYGSDIEFDAQGEFVGIAADVYRVTRDRAFLSEIFEPVVRATNFIDELCARTNGLYGPETRFHGLLAPSISHEGYSKPSYSYWDDYFALSAWRNCEYLAREIGDANISSRAKEKGEAFATDLARSIRMTAERMGRTLIPGSADRDDVDPTSTAIAFEPCRVKDALPAELVPATFDLSADLTESLCAPGFAGNYTPYVVRNLNAFVALGRSGEAFRLVSAVLAGRRPASWRHWAEVVWSDPRAPDYIGDMPHTWIGAEFATAIRRMLLREDGGTLELFRAVPDPWWQGEGIVLRDLPTAFGVVNLKARRRASRITVDLSLTGPAPERVAVRCPGAVRARADGASCAIEREIISSPNFSRLAIDF